MSIVVCIPGTDGVLFYSDGVAYDNDGTILGMASKVLSVAAGSSALSWVGAGSFGPAIASQIGPSTCTFDDLLNRIVEFGKNAVEHLETIDYRWHVSGTALVAGWSDKDQAYRAYTFSSYEKEQMLEGELVMKPAWMLQPLDGMYISTIPHERYRNEAGIHDLFNIDNMPIDELGIRLVCAARLGSRDFEPNEEPVPDSSLSTFAAGGFLQCTFLQRDQFTQTILHRWPDKIGERVDPQSGVAIPEFLTERQPEPAP
jgi:hypothetical protein